MPVVASSANVFGPSAARRLLLAMKSPFVAVSSAGSDHV
jgi:hypothetical protein